MIAETLNSAGYDNAAVTTAGGRNHPSSSTSYLTNKENLDRGIVLKKAGLAKLRISSMSPKLTGELRWLLTPMLPRKISSAKRKNKIKSPKCVECNIFLQWNKLRCPCCDHILRIKPHTNQSKGRSLEEVVKWRDKYIANHVQTSLSDLFNEHRSLVHVKICDPFHPLSLLPLVLRRRMCRQIFEWSNRSKSQLLLNSR
jgi:hypothetical protein